MRKSRKFTRLIGLIMAFAMIAAACGSSSSEEAGDGSGGDGDTTTETAAPDEPDETDDADEGGDDGDEDPGTTEAEPAETGGILTVDIDSGPQEDLSNFNPYMIAKDRGMAGMLAEPLFLPNIITGELDPWLAESVESDDGGTTWTITLRDGVTWSDGEAFDTEDVVFTIDMLSVTPDFSNGPSFDFSSVTVEPVDNLTFTVAHAEASPRWAINTFGNPSSGNTFIVVPEHIWSSVDDVITHTNEDPVFTGAYTVSDVSPSRITYVRNDDWWGAAAGFQDLPAPSEVHWVTYEDEEQKVSAMDRGELDFASNITGPTFQALIARNDDVHGWTDSVPFGSLDSCPRSLHFNNEKITSADVRWAINHAIDRDALISVAYGGAGGESQKSLSFFPAYPALQSYVEGVEAAGLFDEYPVGEFDPEKAKELLAAAGYGEGELSITITAVEQPSEIAMAEVIAEQLQNVGINATFDVAPIPDFVDGIAAGRFEAVVFFLCGSVTDPWQTMDYYHERFLPEEPGGEQGGPPWWNRQRWANSEYSAIVDEMGTLQPGDPKIQDLVIDAFEIWLPDLPEVALVQHPQINPFIDTNWTGFPTADDQYIQLMVASPAFHQILHELEPAS